MEVVAKFEKVSYEQFKKDVLNDYLDCDEERIKSVYDNIKLPKRSTKQSAGYDFYIPEECILPVRAWAKIPTGIKCKIKDGWVLQLYPRSGQGFKYGVHLANTVGVVDADYYEADNEGHIFVKLVNDSAMGKPMTIEKHTAFCQGIFVPFGITEDDNSTEQRHGGFGSTDK